jgi:RNA recognition motif-containing protein
LDNYSFIQVRTTVADTIIEALNGKSFRGRTLAVNYARNRKEDAPEEQEAELSERLSGDDA